jgi:hypothetical protein
LIFKQPKYLIGSVVRGGVFLVDNVRVYAVRKLKDKKKNTRREQTRRFYSDIVLQVRVKSAILRFKAQDETISSALK